jgi:hypothetical protein
MPIHESTPRVWQSVKVAARTYEGGKMSEGKHIEEATISTFSVHRLAGLVTNLSYLVLIVDGIPIHSAPGFYPRHQPISTTLSTFFCLADALQT